MVMLDVFATYYIKFSQFFIALNQRFNKTLATQVLQKAGNILSKYMSTNDNDSITNMTDILIDLTRMTHVSSKVGSRDLSFSCHGDLSRDVISVVIATCHVTLSSVVIATFHETLAEVVIATYHVTLAEVFIATWSCMTGHFALFAVLYTLKNQEKRYKFAFLSPQIWKISICFPTARLKTTGAWPGTPVKPYTSLYFKTLTFPNLPLPVFTCCSTK